MLSLFLVFVFVSSAKPWDIVARLLLLLGSSLRRLIVVLGLEALSIVRPSLGMTVYCHLAEVTRRVWHGVVGIVSIL